MRLFNLNKRSPYFHVVVYGLMFIVFANVAVCVWYVIGQKQYQSTIDTSGEIESYGPINLRISSSSFNVLPATLHVHKKDSHFEHDSESHKSSKDGSHIAESDRFSADDKSVHRNLPPCPLMPPGLQGTVYVETKARFTFEEIQQKHNNTLIGGRHKPLNCTSNNRVAIIVPYRNRKHHLLLFLNHMHLFLQRQQLDYGIFVVELAPTVRFNRALLMNIGFVEASRHYGYDCFIFHDVDLLPENDWNLYTCSQQSPKHLSVAINKFDYSLPYMTLFGGVSAMTRDQFQLLNGYSNKYFGWGGEDDDMFNRVNASHMVLLRYTPDVARYQMLEHNQDGKNPSRNRRIKHPDLVHWDGNADPVIVAIVHSIKTKCQKSSVFYILFCAGIFQLVIGVFFILMKSNSIVKRQTADFEYLVESEAGTEPEVDENFNPRLYLNESWPNPLDILNYQVTNLGNRGNVTLNQSLGFTTPSVSENIKSDKPLCRFMSPYLGGQISIERNHRPSFALLENKFKRLRKGGHYTPPRCKARHKVAIIVPYRNRRQHLITFLNHMHQFLPIQELEYRIFVVELHPRLRFNKGVMLNAGFLEADRQGDFDCFIFHDVDLVPENDNNLYICSPTSPKHLSVAVSTFHYKLSDYRLIGGVNAMTKDQFITVNGYSNKFYGWGGEDDDLYYRITANHMTLSRYNANIGRYTMLPHKKRKANPQRYRMLRLGKHRWMRDGLNSLKYKIINIELLKLCTYILIDIDINDSAFKTW